jgi:hypothetical protein
LEKGDLGGFEVFHGKSLCQQRKNVGWAQPTINLSTGWINPEDGE